MKKNEIKVLIVEDDKSFGDVLRVALLRSGYQCVVSQTPQDALQQLKNNLFGATVIDCLLPKMSGVELAAQVRADGNLAGPIFLMSGIFKDKVFMQDSLRKTGAVHFFSKPFNLEDLIKAIDTELSSIIEETHPPLQELLMKQNPSPGEKIDAVKKTPSISGNELPKIFEFLVSSSSNGVLELIDEEEQKTKVGFWHGKIVNVEASDRPSFFGALLVERKLITHELIESVVSQPNPLNKRLGERLVDANMISPHVIGIINTDQIGIRMSQMIRNVTYSMSFKDGNSDSIEREGFFDGPNLLSFLMDCITSKISTEWLKTHYLVWDENPVCLAANFDRSSAILTFGPITRLPNLIGDLELGTEFNKLALRYSKSPSDFYAAIHLLAINQMIVFRSVAKSFDSTGQIKRLQQIQKEFSQKDDFEILGVPRKTKSTDIRKSYYELSKTFHPDRMSPDSPEELVRLNKQIFSRMTSAYNRLMDDDSRAAYLKELEIGQAEKILEAEGTTEEGKALLKAGQGAKALEKFLEASAVQTGNSELALYTLWARLTTVNTTTPNVATIHNLVSEGLSRIPPEDRHYALYYFVKGLFQKQLGDLESARDNILHAVSIKPEFIEAKRELNLLEIGQKGKKVDILNSDLKEVVGLLFRRKK